MGSSIPECILVRAFSYINIDYSGTRESVSWLHSMKSTSSGNAEPYALHKMKARTGGEKGRLLCCHGGSKRRPLRINLSEPNPACWGAACAGID